MTSAEGVRSLDRTIAAPVAADWVPARVDGGLPDLPAPQVLAAAVAALDAAGRRHFGGLLGSDRDRGPIVTAIDGRLHLSLAQLRALAGRLGVPAALLLRATGHADAARAGDELAPALPRIAVFPGLRDRLRLAGRPVRPAAAMRAHDARFRRTIDRLTAAERRTLPDLALWTVVEESVAAAPALIETLLWLGIAALHEGRVRTVCDRLGVPFDRLVALQKANAERSIKAQQACDLAALADTARREPRVLDYLHGEPSHISHLRFALRGTAFLHAFERFLAIYGHRSPCDYDWSLPRYNEDPTPLLFALRRQVDGVARGRDDMPQIPCHELDAATPWRDLGRRAFRFGRWITVAGLERSIRRIAQREMWRQSARSDVARVVGALRSWHLVLADRFVERGWLGHRDDYFLITLDEIAAVVAGRQPPDSFCALVAARRAEQERRHGV